MVLPAQRHRMPTAAADLGVPTESAPEAPARAERLLIGDFVDRPAPRAWGWATPGGGRSANVEGGVVYQATSAQVCGLYPFAMSSGAATPGVPIGRHMLTGNKPHEILCGRSSSAMFLCQAAAGSAESAVVAGVARVRSSVRRAAKTASESWRRSRRSASVRVLPRAVSLSR